MVDKNSAPSYSIAGKTGSFIKSNGLPGPGTYQPTTYFKMANSHDKLPKGKRFSDYGNVVPGPGAYTYEISKQAHVPTALVLSRSKQSKPSVNPGPGSYQPDFHKIVKSNSSYKIGQQIKHPDYTKAVSFIPGPGKYDVGKSTLLGLNQAAGFGPERKIQLGIDPKTPGPGTYSQTAYYNGAALKQPNTVFSKSNRSQSYNNIVPGPGAYVVKTEIQDSLTRTKGFKIGQKVTGHKQPTQKLPGPGAYQEVSPNLLKKSTPSFSIGKDAKLKIDNIRQIMSKPGPLSYDTKVTALQSKSVVIGKDKRKGLGTQTGVPGPGAYDQKTQLSSQTYSLPKSDRKSLADSKNTPSPCDYDPKKVFNTQYEGIKVGTDHRRTFDIKQKYPGPGQYHYYDTKKQQGGFIIGKQKRGQNKDNKVPGPGQYELPSYVSNLPNYVSTAKK